MANLTEVTATFFAEEQMDVQPILLKPFNLLPLIHPVK